MRGGHEIWCSRAVFSEVERLNAGIIPILAIRRELWYAMQQGAMERRNWVDAEFEGHLAHKKQRPPRTLQ